jgi:hypothetical protein
MIDFFLVLGFSPFRGEGVVEGPFLIWYIWSTSTLSMWHSISMFLFLMCWFHFRGGFARIFMNLMCFRFHFRSGWCHGGGFWSRIWCILRTIALFLIPFSLCYFWDLLFWCYLGFRVLFNFSGWGSCGLYLIFARTVILSRWQDIFPVIIFSVPSMMQF